ncbi:hypothetical protein Ddye_011810 [Dipteronia dyeriana]|uniref:F-box protein n=1 Tax=Dipteronia dyeriana TaxID=168575 RepID=A0AAE0CHM5_9ROSI|nr:hypothetical protein Ddye_011810 [Dipteronia dyeriana]
MSRSQINRRPPWEVLSLVAQHLDPKTLAVASCVSKSWFTSMSSDHLWQPICFTHSSPLSNLKLTYPSVPYRRLYALAVTAAKRRFKPPSTPRISLENLLFAIELSTKDFPLATVARPADELCVDLKGVFRFDIDVDYGSFPAAETLEEVKITWNVVLRGWQGIFTMIDCEEKLKLRAGSGGWFSDSLPSPGCCSSEMAASGIVADLKLGFCRMRESYGKIRVDKVSVGILSVVNWRYVSVDDGLRYLQHFLLTK